MLERGSLENVVPYGGPRVRILLPPPASRLRTGLPPAGYSRNLGISTVIDRVIQQAVLQRLQPHWDPTFS